MSSIAVSLVGLPLVLFTHSKDYLAFEKTVGANGYLCMQDGRHTGYVVQGAFFCIMSEKLSV